jgi:hypothetical protein
MKLVNSGGPVMNFAIEFFRTRPSGRVAYLGWRNPPVDRLVDANPKPKQYKSSRKAVPWAFATLVVQ